MAQVFVVGLTGGIASGKSTIAKALEDEGASLINADLLGHEAYLPGTECLKELVGAFGEKILASDGTVDRKALGAVVFSDPKHLEKLNEIVWPAIRSLIIARVDDIRNRHSASEASSPSIVVVEAAILLEAKWQDLVDEIWVVSTPFDIAKERLMARNKLSENDAEARINSQMSNDDRCARGDKILDNGSNLDSMLSAVTTAFHDLHARLMSLSAFEEIDVVDDSNNVVRVAKRAVVRAYNLWHRATYIVVFQSGSNKVFVQTRSKLKDYCPGCLDPAPGGVLSAGEDPTESAQRELEEEMGIQNVNLTPHGVFPYSDAKTKCFCYVFSCVIAADVTKLKLQVSEVESVKLMTEEEILGLDSDTVLPDGLMAFQHVVSSRGKI